MQNWKETIVTKCEINHERTTKGFPFLPEWFESEKTSPHHNEKVAAACSHCSHTLKAPELLNIVPAYVLSRVTTITFHRWFGGACEGKLPSVNSCPCAAACEQLLQETPLFISSSAAAGRFRSSRLCRGMHKGAKKRLFFNDCSHPFHSPGNKVESSVVRQDWRITWHWPTLLSSLKDELFAVPPSGIAPSNDSDREQIKQIAWA